MELEVITEIPIYRPAQEVFEALFDQDKMADFFTSLLSSLTSEGKTAGSLQADSVPGMELVHVIPNEMIQFNWTVSIVPTSVLLTFTPITHTSTLLKVVEGHWSKNSEGLRSYAQQMQTWTYFNVRLKLFLEHGLHLDSFLNNPNDKAS
ncbi:hypothetical protein DYBT9275_01854 [Dyadobacter sp. CECT 9275]|uniref:SRPBCC domain-containing protein n=1 Tax=Dyadobacter helix TaxID=2822344 RepID=A0A916JAT4_9BACT|nr:hypothetical protein [Dyadobacter sp. CECT 9275]CAG4997800.1 hypothetical protein DYBT9275_01854 [Dyadobacter sp. CECT 9275]